MIIIEGADNSGKSTLAGEIASRYGLEVLKSIGPKANYDWWISHLRVPAQTAVFTVADRFLFSEFIYGPFFRNRISVSTHQIEVLKNMTLALKPLIIRCHFVADRAQFENRVQIFEYENQVEIDRLFNAYDFSPFRIVDYNFTDSATVTSTWKAIFEWFSERDKLAAIRSICDYGRGPLPAPYVVVGIDFSSNNSHHIPFEQSKSAVLIHRFLKEVGLNPIEGYFTNVHKFDEGLSPQNLTAIKNECDLSGTNHIIAFGKPTSMMLAVANRNHVFLKHPGYFIRNSQGDEFLKYAIEAYNHQLKMEPSLRVEAAR